MKSIITVFFIFLLISPYYQLGLIRRKTKKIKNFARNLIKKSKVVKIDVSCKGDQWLDKIDLMKIIKSTNAAIKQQQKDGKGEKEDELISEETGEMRMTRVRIMQHSKFYVGADATDDDLPMGYTVCVKSCPKSLEKECLEDKQKDKFKRAYFFYIEKCINDKKVRVSYVGQDKNCRDAVGTSTPWIIAQFQTIQLDLIKLIFPDLDVKKDFDEVVKTATTYAEKEIKEKSSDIVKQAVQDFVKDILNTIIAAIVEKVIESLKWAYVHIVLTVLDFTPLVVLSGPIHLAVTAAQIGIDIYDFVSGVKSKIDKIAKYLMDFTFQPLLQKSKIKKEKDLLDKGIAVYDSLKEIANNPNVDTVGNLIGVLDSNPGSKRSFKGFINSINCALTKEKEHNIPAQRNLMKGLYNAVVKDDKDKETVLDKKIQEVYNGYYNGCK